MREEDKGLTTFTTHRGLFQFNVMPFGLINAPATFSHIMHKLLEGTERLHNYLDDVLASTKCWQSHLVALRELFNRARAGCLAIRPSKCSVGYNSVKFLGFTVKYIKGSHNVGADFFKPP